MEVKLLLEDFFSNKPHSGELNPAPLPMSFGPLYLSEVGCNNPHSDLSCALLGQVLGHLSGSDKMISWCRRVTPEVKAEMGQILKEGKEKKASSSERYSDAAATTSTLVDSAAVVAALKR